MKQLCRVLRIKIDMNCDCPSSLSKIKWERKNKRQLHPTLQTIEKRKSEHPLYQNYLEKTVYNTKNYKLKYYIVFKNIYQKIIR